MVHVGGALKVIDVDHVSGDALFPALRTVGADAWFIDFKDTVDGWDPDQTMTLPTLETVGGRLRVETSVPGYAMVPNFPALASAGSLRIGPHGALDVTTYSLKATVPRISFPRLAHVEFQMVLSFLQPESWLTTPAVYSTIPRNAKRVEGYRCFVMMYRPSVDFPALQTLGGRGTWPQSASPTAVAEGVVHSPWKFVATSEAQGPLCTSRLWVTVPYLAQMRTRPSYGVGSVLLLDVRYTTRISLPALRWTDHSIHFNDANELAASPFLR